MTFGTGVATDGVTAGVGAAGWLVAAGWAWATLGGSGGVTFAGSGVGGAWRTASSEAFWRCSTYQPSPPTAPSTTSTAMPMPMSRLLFPAWALIDRVAYG